MNSIDGSRAQTKAAHTLGERFEGRSPAGRTVGFTNDGMLLDGAPFFGVSGELHFSRVSPDQWMDSLVKLRMGGIDIVSTYVFWNVHEEIEGRFRFDGCRDLRRFLELCKRLRLWVILRVGPFAHGEMRNGGLPDWLYGKPFEVRESNAGYLECARRFYRAIGEQAKGFFFAEDGPVIGVQIENEFMHSSAPWEQTTGAANEWVGGGQGGNAHMLDLKRIAVEEGLVAPFYTCTAWGGAMTPTDEMLPLWGGYAYQPWIFYSHTGEHPLTPEYIYRDNHNDAVRSTYNFEPRYAPESRPYACCEMMGGMMCSYNYRFTLPPESVDALANIKLGSGCTLLGYYMYRGGTTPTGERTPFLNEGQICKRSYDYQAPVGEFGQLRPSYFRLRTLHDLCHSFADRLIGARTALPDWGDAMEPGDASRLRFCARVKDGAGFVFLNNFQDHAKLPARHGETVTVRLPGEEIILGPLDLASGENAVLPFNLPMDGALLKWASAQPITRLTIDGEPCWFFMAPEGMEPRFRFAGESEARVCRPDADFALQTADGAARVVVLSRETSLRFCHIQKDGRDIAVLSDGAFLWDGERATLETTAETGFIATFPADALDAEALRGRVAELAPYRLSVFRGFRFRRSVAPVPAPSVEQVGPSRYALSIPPESLAGHKATLLRVRYMGDVGQAFVEEEMISDNLCNGQPWDVRLDDRREALQAKPLTLYLTPIRQGAKVSVDSAMAARMEHAEGRIASLDGTELVYVDSIDISLR